MKKILLSIAALCYFFTARAQSKSATDSFLNIIDTSVNLDLLQAPASPAFNLLGISPSSIDRPTDLNTFRLSIQNATNNFSKIPSNYSAEFAPASLLRIKNQTLEQFNSTKFRNVFWQSFSVSLGLIRSNVADEDKEDSTTTTKLGFGIKFSIVRPKWTDSTQRYIDSLYFYMNASNKERIKRFNNDPAIKEIETNIQAVGNSPSLTLQQKKDSIDRLNEQKTKLQELLVNNFIKKLDSTNVVNIKRLASGLKVVRKGGFLDFATGIVADFPNDRFDKARTAKAGAWLTGGYEGGEKLSILAIARYLYQPDKIFADDSAKLKTDNISTFDAGARIIAGGGSNKFSVSLEGLYRSVLSKNTIPSSWRLVFNASYDIGSQRMITLALGRNFDGVIAKGGNLIAALNFIKGFGSGKKVK
jgi:hypothetical protein